MQCVKLNSAVQTLETRSKKKGIERNMNKKCGRRRIKVKGQKKIVIKERSITVEPGNMQQKKSVIFAMDGEGEM